VDLIRDKGSAGIDVLVMSTSSRAWLGHNRQGEIVASAPVVVGFEGIAAAAEGRSIRQVGEGAADWVS